VPRIAQSFFAGVVFIGVIAADQRASVAPVVAASTTEPEIVRLVSRGQTITILAGRGQSLYSVSDAWGRRVVSRATLEQLRASYPEIYRQVAPGVALYAGLGD
jgi:hypothetical protein